MIRHAGVTKSQPLALFIDALGTKGVVVTHSQYIMNLKRMVICVYKTTMLMTMLR